MNPVEIVSDWEEESDWVDWLLAVLVVSCGVVTLLGICRSRALAARGNALAEGQLYSPSQTALDILFGCSWLVEFTQGVAVTVYEKPDTLLISTFILAGTFVVSEFLMMRAPQCMKKYGLASAVHETLFIWLVQEYVVDIAVIPLLVGLGVLKVFLVAATYGIDDEGDSFCSYLWLEMVLLSSEAVYTAVFVALPAVLAQDDSPYLSMEYAIFAIYIQAFFCVVLLSRRKRFDGVNLADSTSDVRFAKRFLFSWMYGCAGGWLIYASIALWLFFGVWGVWHYLNVAGDQYVTLGLGISHLVVGPLYFVLTCIFF